MRNLLLLLLPLYLGYHLFTLNRVTVPSYEEASLAISTVDMEESNAWYYLGNLQHVGEATPSIKSPLFSFCNVWVAKYLGVNLFSFRLLGVFFGVCTLLLFFSFLGYFEKGSFKNASFLLTLAFMVDPVISQLMHANGHIMAATFFLLLSLRVDFKQEEYTFYSTLLSAFCFVTSIFFFLPVLFLFPILIVYKLMMSFSGISNGKSHFAFHLLFWPVFILIFISPWLLITQLNVLGVLKSMWLQCAWPTSISLTYPCYFLVGSAVLGILYSMLQNNYEVKNASLVMFLIGISTSYLFATALDLNYFQLLIPFLYLLIFSVLPLNITDNNARVGRYLPLVILLVFNCLIFSIQTISNLVDYPNRSDADLKAFVAKNVTKGKTVIGDATASFAFLGQGYKYQAIHSSLDLSEKLKKGKQDYAAIGLGFENTHAFISSTLEFEGYQKIAKIQYFSSPLSRFLGDWGIVSDNERELYSVQLYKRK